MITFNDLVNVAPLISEKLLKTKEYTAIAVIVFSLGFILFFLYSLFEYFVNKKNRLLTAPWIPTMEAQTDKQLQKDLDKLIRDPRLPISYFKGKTKNLGEQYQMIDDFMKICRKRGIKEN